jgi:hypothetical protein
MLTLYHYCSTKTFQSIVEGRNIWLSSLEHSNDTTEGKLVAKTLACLAEEDGLPTEAARLIQAGLARLSETLGGLGFCLSEDGDLLSQWRGYADNGSGISIGFSRGYLDWLGEASRDEARKILALSKVEYDLGEHKAAVSDVYTEIKKNIELGAFDLPGRRGLLDMRSDEQIAQDDGRIFLGGMTVHRELLKLGKSLFLLKSPEFREECEWRLISYLLHLNAPHDCAYRNCANQLIPYRSFDLLDHHRAITHIVLGPKHKTPANMVKSFLKSNGFDDVEVRSSNVTYR